MKKSNHTFKLEFGMDNDAFIVDEKAEIKRILLKAIDEIENGTNYLAIQDINGNSIGYMNIMYKRGK